MKLPIAQLMEGENRFHFESQKDGWLKEVIQRVERQGYKVESPLITEVSLTKLEPDYYLRGRMEFTVQQTCARCADTFSLLVRHPFDVALAHISNAKVRRAELVAEESGELDVNFFEGNDIDLGPIVEEQFFLSIPYQSVCRTDCKGICQQCGKDLNVTVCGCRPNQADHPFSALQGMKV